MCLDIHPENAFLVAVGLYDGKVAVYDFREVNNPVFQSDARSGKHTDPVWQVRVRTCIHVGYMHVKCTCTCTIVRKERYTIDYTASLWFLFIVL